MRAEVELATAVAKVDRISCSSDREQQQYMKQAQRGGEGTELVA